MNVEKKMELLHSIFASVNSFVPTWVQNRNKLSKQRKWILKCIKSAYKSFSICYKLNRLQSFVIRKQKIHCSLFSFVVSSSFVLISWCNWCDWCRDDCIFLLPRWLMFFSITGGEEHLSFSFDIVIQKFFWIIVLIVVVVPGCGTKPTLASSTVISSFFATFRTSLSFAMISYLN